MPRFQWTERFIDERVCTVEAETLEEALAKQSAGPWKSEQTIDFHSTGERTELVQVESAEIE